MAGVLVSGRAPQRVGQHIMVCHPSFPQACPIIIMRGVIVADVQQTERYPLCRS
jgi:hypothetical protein